MIGKLTKLDGKWMIYNHLFIVNEKAKFFPLLNPSLNDTTLAKLYNVSSDELEGKMVNYEIEKVFLDYNEVSDTFYNQKEFAVLSVNEKSKKADTWSDIYEECKNCTSSPSMTKGVITWLEKNYEVPKKKH